MPRRKESTARDIPKALREMRQVYDDPAAAAESSDASIKKLAEWFNEDFAGFRKELLKLEDKFGGGEVEEGYDEGTAKLLELIPRVLEEVKQRAGV